MGCNTSKYASFVMSQTCGRYGSLSSIFNKLSTLSVEYFLFVSELSGMELSCEVRIRFESMFPSTEKTKACVILIYEVEINFVKLQSQPYSIDYICHLKELFLQSTS